MAAGLVLVDKPAGWTSHDVVGRVRRLAGTRRVGHAGTLDPMATGVLVLGVDRATKLLGYLAGKEKEYRATIRLGQSTVTDDAEGVPTGGANAAGIGEPAIRARMHALTGCIEQVPSSVSAVKVDGKRAYARVRAGESVELKARQVTVSRFDLLEMRPATPELVDVDVLVECSSGTYVRALARDLGAALGVGGHLTVLRRTRVGPFGIDECATLEQLAQAPDPVTVSLDRAIGESFRRRDLTAGEAAVVGHGGRLTPAGMTGTYAVFGPDGHAVALVEERGGFTRPVVVVRPS